MVKDTESHRGSISGLWAGLVSGLIRPQHLGSSWPPYKLLCLKSKQPDRKACINMYLKYISVLSKPAWEKLGRIFGGEKELVSEKRNKNPKEYCMQVKVNGTRPTSVSTVSSSLGAGELCSRYSWDFWIQACLGMGGVETVSLDKENGLWASRREVLPSVWWVLKPDLGGVGVQMQMAGKVGILAQSGCALKCMYVFHREIWDHIQKNPSFGSVMPLLGIYLAKRIKYVCICLALWKIIVILLTKAEHFSSSMRLSTEE